MGKLARVFSVALATLGVTAATAIGSASAAAATTYYTDGCYSGSQAHYTVALGDAVAFAVPGEGPPPCDITYTGDIGVDVADSDDEQFVCITFTFHADTQVYLGNLSFAVGSPVTAGAAPSASPAAAASCGWPVPSAAGEPIVVHQAVGMPASGSCDAVADADLSGGTGVKGGWTASWAQWPNGGTGGAVCTRALVNDGTWHLG